MSRFGETFTTPKPILGMLHLAGEGPDAALAVYRKAEAP